MDALGGQLRGRLVPSAASVVERGAQPGRVRRERRHAPAAAASSRSAIAAASRPICALARARPSAARVASAVCTSAVARPSARPRREVAVLGRVQRQRTGPQALSCPAVLRGRAGTAGARPSVAGPCPARRRPCASNQADRRRAPGAQPGPGERAAAAPDRGWCPG